MVWEDRLPLQSACDVCQSFRSFNRGLKRWLVFEI